MPNDGVQLIELLRAGKPNGIWKPSVGQTTSSLKEYWLRTSFLPNENSANKVITEAYQILAQCIPPSANVPMRTGLVCGYVQSGKTASMTAVSALAKDNGYRIIIFLAGVTTNLVAQNTDRLETHLRKASPEWAWLMLENPRAARNLHQIENLAQEWHSNQYDENDRRTLLISVMKNHSHLRHITNLLSGVDLSDVPTIIFDDEADQASLNTRPRAPIASSTYRNIDALRQIIPRHSYLQYTATPQAPLLITRIDSLSADFAELVSPGERYVGGQEFFGNPNNYVATIPAVEIYQDGQLPTEPPESFIHAMQVFFVGVACGRLGTTREHRSMLIHPSKSTETQLHYYNWANRVRAYWHNVLVSPSEPDRAEIIEQFRRAYKDVAHTCDGLPSFNDVQAKLPVAINQTAVTLVNSVDGHEVQWENGYSHILVGGEKLGRGYTVKGLTVTYMPRSPGGWTADTIQQRARFFGYHSDYLGFCRIYLHPATRNAYVSYVRHEDDMRARLGEHRGRPLREWRRLFYLDQRLAPTRRNVLLSPYFRPRLPGGWFWPSAPHLSPGRGVDNAHLVRRLERIQLAPDANHPQHSYALVYLREVYEQVLVPLSYYDDDDSLGLCVVNCNLKTCLERDGDSQCLVYFMSRGQSRERTLTAGRIPQLFQGRSSAGSDSYPGDRFFSHTQYPTVQVHMLNVKEGNQMIGDVPAVAVKLVRQEGMLGHDD